MDKWFLNKTIQSPDAGEPIQTIGGTKVPETEEETGEHLSTTELVQSSTQDELNSQVFQAAREFKKKKKEKEETIR